MSGVTPFSLVVNAFVFPASQTQSKSDCGLRARPSGIKASTHLRCPSRRAYKPALALPAFSGAALEAGWAGKFDAPSSDGAKMPRSGGWWGVCRVGCARRVEGRTSL